MPLSQYSTPISLWKGPTDDATGDGGPAGPGGPPSPGPDQGPGAPDVPPADPVPDAATPPPPDSGGLGLSGPMAGGTGYISMADYINGNQDQIAAERGMLDTNAMAQLKAAQDQFGASSADAIKGVPQAERDAMNAAYGFDTADAYRKTEDYRATRAAHPDVPWQGVPPATPQAGRDVSQAPDLGYIHGPSEGDTPLPGTGTNNDAPNPYSLVGYNPDFQDVKARLGNTEAGAKAGADFEALGNTGAQVGNLANWGGVFDALSHQNIAAGSSGANFDATLIGRGLQGTADKGNAAQGDASKAFDAGIQGAFGQNDQAGYKGRDTYQAPTDTRVQHSPDKPNTSYGTDDSGNRGGETPGPTQTGYGAPNNSGGGTDDSGGNRGGGNSGDSGGQSAPVDPNDPWGQQDPWGTGGG